MSQNSRPTELYGYPVRHEQWRIGDHAFDLAWPADSDGLLDAPETRRRFKQDEYMPYWAQPWPSSILLAEEILKSEPGRGRPAVEIGCGIGLVSLAAATHGWQVTATDYDPDAVRFAEFNSRRNHLPLAARTLDYRILPERREYACVLAADLLYERRLIEPVANWIAAALLPGGYALISDPNRSAADGFPQAAQAHGLSVESDSRESRSPAGLIIHGRIWRVGYCPD